MKIVYLKSSRFLKKVPFGLFFTIGMYPLLFKMYTKEHFKHTQKKIELYILINPPYTHNLVPTMINSRQLLSDLYPYPFLPNPDYFKGNPRYITSSE